MDRLSLPAISLAGTRAADAATSRANRQPVKQAPLPEPSQSPTRDSRDTGNTVGTGFQPISLPPTLQADGLMSPDKGRGTVLHVTA